MPTADAVNSPPNELDALADFGWHLPDLKGVLATCVNAVRLRWRPQASHRIEPTHGAVSRGTVARVSSCSPGKSSARSTRCPSTAAPRLGDGREGSLHRIADRLEMDATVVLDGRIEQGQVTRDGMPPSPAGRAPSARCCPRCR